MVAALDAIPWKERQWGHALARNTINVKQKLGLGFTPKNGRRFLSEGWAQNLANELHQPIRRRFPKRRVISYGIDNIWAADLVEMGKFSKWNKGIKYLLMVIDVFSKFGWIRPLKDKRGQTVADAFRSIFRERKPKMLWTDKGSEFFNAIMKDLLHKNGVKIVYHRKRRKIICC